MKADEIRKIIEASPLAAHADAIMKLAVPAVKMNTYLVEEGDLPLGASRMGGAPDLPPGMAWPEHNGRSIEFLAQIDFAAAARAYTLPDLPSKGWLVVFCDFQGYCDNKGYWAVRYFEGDATMLVRSEHPGKPAENINFCEIKFEREDCLPDISDLINRFGPKDEGEQEDLWEYLDDTLEPIEKGPYHRLGGYPDLIQSELDEYRDWEFLLQIDSDYELGWMWGDMGKLYFWVMPQDLKTRKFEKTWCNEEFH